MMKKCCIKNDNIMQLILVLFFFLDELVVWYFGNFLGFRGILVNFWIWGYFVHFLVSGVFWSFYEFLGYFGNFWVWGVFW